MSMRTGRGAAALEGDLVGLDAATALARLVADGDDGRTRCRRPDRPLGGGPDRRRPVEMGGTGFRARALGPGPLARRPAARGQLVLVSTSPSSTTQSRGAASASAARVSRTWAGRVAPPRRRSGRAATARVRGRTPGLPRGSAVRPPTSGGAACRARTARRRRRPDAGGDARRPPPAAAAWSTPSSSGSRRTVSSSVAWAARRVVTCPGQANIPTAASG